MAQQYYRFRAGEMGVNVTNLLVDDTWLAMIPSGGNLVRFSNEGIFH